MQDNLKGRPQLWAVTREKHGVAGERQAHS